MTAASLYCPACGSKNSAHPAFCSACGQALTTGASSRTGLLIPSHLLKGRYRILAQVGRGGFGAVYQAEDRQLGNRLVAIKEMSQYGLAPQELAQAIDAFQHEAIMLAGLRHPNLPRIYDQFAEAGRQYLVMDFIEGQTLEAYVGQRGGSLPVDEVLQIGLQLCNVLEYLHTRQPPIIFRDLKPENVMVAPDGQLCLIDFGIARHFKPGQSRDTIAFGSPGYAAPEQYGKAQTTPRSDLFSLGAMLHHLLSGNDPSSSPFRFAPLHLASPAGLEALISQMVEIDEYKRPDSAETVKQELQRLIASLPVPVPVAQAALQQPHAAQPAQPAPAALPQLQTPALLSVTTAPAPRPIIHIPHSTYIHHDDWVWSVAWSPDGKRIASASRDRRTVQVWNASSRYRSFLYTGHSGIVYTVAWSLDGKRIASAGLDKTVQVWEPTAPGVPICIYAEHIGAVRAVAWSPDGTHLASGGLDKMVHVWKPQ